VKLGVINDREKHQNVEKHLEGADRSRDPSAVTQSRNPERQPESQSMIPIRESCADTPRPAT
jgi:hypothetical protein